MFPPQASATNKRQFAADKSPDIMFNMKRNPDEEPSSGEADGGAEGRAKKLKFSRSRTACLQCRSRKTKCGALPPNPCPNCIEAQLHCEWPAEDGRSSKARLMRAKSGAPGRPPDKHHDDSGLYTGNKEINTAGYAGGQDGVNPADLGVFPSSTPDWFDRVLAGGSIDTPSSSGPSFSNITPTANPIPQMSPVNGNQPFNLNVPGPSNYYLPTPNTSDSLNYPLGGIFQNSGQNPGGPLDPAQFMWAMSSRLPMVEESSPADERSNVSGPSPMTAADPNSALSVRAQMAQRRDGGSAAGAGKIVKISWWRPHGQTAIAPGLKRITLKVRVDSPQETLAKASPHTTMPSNHSDHPAQELFGADGAPSTSIMRHLLDLFSLHFGCQFAFLDKADLLDKAETRSGSLFLMNCIAGMAARFSTNPAIALAELEPWAYGNVFYNRAKAMLGAMLSVPSRDTIAGFIMLAHMSFANDSESELWMLTGMAVRMSIDLGLHINPPEESTITREDRRLNRLVFYAVLLMDYALSFGVGRQTAIRPEDITQTLPTETDLHPSTSTHDSARSPFAYAAQMMQSYGPLINMLNQQQSDTSGQNEQEIQAARAACIREYNQLPQDMQWNVTNRANQGPIFLHLHLWMHTILASGYLTGTNLLRRSHHTATAGAKSGQATPNSATASTLWRNSARTVGDILVLSDIINPQAYLAIPFTNQAFFVASCCYVKDIDQHMSQPVSPAGSPKRVPKGLNMTPMVPHHPDQGNATNGELSAKQVDLSRALLTSVAKTNIATLQGGLEKQATYWSGVAWVMAALEKRIEGIQDVDLQGVTEKLKSFVSLPDAGLIGRVMTANGGEVVAGENGNEDGEGTRTPIPWAGFTPGYSGLVGVGAGGGSGEGQFDFDALDFLSLPFDLGTGDSAQNVTEMDVPLPQTWQTDWFS